MSRLGAKTYSRRNECKTSVQFDHLLSEKGNKPSTAKVSVAAVHRWGMTSFTSLRKTHLNGQNDPASDNTDQVKRCKKEPVKTTHTTTPKDPFNFETGVELSSVDCHNFLNPVGHNSETSVKPKKFFKSSESSKKRLNAVDSGKPIVESSLRLPVLPSYSVTKFEDELKKERTTIKHPCESVNNGKSLQNYVCMDSVQLADPSPPECVSLSVKLDPFKPVNFLNVSHGSAVHDQFSLEGKTKQQTYDPSFNTAVIGTHGDMNIINSVISDISKTTVKSLDFVQRCDNNSEKYSMEKWEQLTVLHDTQSPTDEVAKLNVNADGGGESAVSVPISSSNEQHIVKNEVSDVHCPDVFSKEQNIKSKNIFRSKKIFNSSKKPKAVYNHRHWQSFREENMGVQNNDLEKDEVSVDSASRMLQQDDFQEMKESLDSEIQLLPNEPAEQQLYEVAGNVKQAYQVHESGEAQEFNDDIEYLLEGLQCSNAIGTRCLSVLGLATKCMGPAFRIHLRAHGTMPKIFSALQDAPADPNLSLCAATLLFVLSQDRLTMDIDASTLSMMLQLLETDQGSGNTDKDMDLILDDPGSCSTQEKHREKIYQLCEQMKQKGHAKHLKLDNINASILAMEALLSLTSRKAGEWFKEEIRTLHGLDRIVDTVASSVDALSGDDAISQFDEVQLDKIQKIDRCLRVLENVTYMNFENQDYLLHYKEALVSSCCLRLIKLCKSSLLKTQGDEHKVSLVASDETQKNVSTPILFCLLSVMKVLLNITFENSLACSRIGSEPGLIENVLMCIFQVPRAVPNEKRFDLLVLSLGLMINLVEHCCENRRRLMETISMGSFDTINDGYEIPASEGLVEVLHNRLEAARKSEEQADELLNSADVLPSAEKKDSDSASSQAECLEETLMKTLQKAGKHMEHSIIAAYISLLLGCVMQNNQEYVNIIKDYTPEGKFDAMIDVLKKFMSFVSLTGSVGSTGVKSIQRIIEVFNNNR